MRLVEQAEFDLIECNRCGDCCERFHVPNGGDWREPPHSWWNHDGPLGFLEEWAYNKAKGWEEPYFHPIDSMMFFGELVATQDEEGWWWYSCSRFRRDGLDCGTCTRHDTRPNMCREFPYGKPITAYDRCAWNVTLLLEPLISPNPLT